VLSENQIILLNKNLLQRFEKLNLNLVQAKNIEIIVNNRKVLDVNNIILVNLGFNLMQIQEFHNIQQNLMKQLFFIYKINVTNKEKNSDGGNSNSADETGKFMNDINKDVIINSGEIYDDIEENKSGEVGDKGEIFEGEDNKKDKENLDFLQNIHSALTDKMNQEREQMKNSDEVLKKEFEDQQKTLKIKQKFEMEALIKEIGLNENEKGEKIHQLKENQQKELDELMKKKFEKEKILNEKMKENENMLKQLQLQIDDIMEQIQFYTEQLEKERERKKKEEEERELKKREEDFENKHKELMAEVRNKVFFLLI
jgi:hypothetical protein